MDIIHVGFHVFLYSRVCRHVTLSHFLDFEPTSLCLREAENTNFIVFGLIDLNPQSTTP